jgi:2-oxoglutarate dehydrogenase E1 component
MRPIDFSSANREYVEALYEQYCADPSSVDPEWVVFFRGFDYGFQLSEEERADSVDGSEVVVAPATGVRDVAVPTSSTSASPAVTTPDSPPATVQPTIS